ncbi:MAG: molybdopterin-dependent oxidoreductase [Chloroflexi bacterium]|nr:molybdopterin-dependent oxidoreductase [Chloroflexota bacterium]
MSEPNVITQALTETPISRRSFLKWSAVLGGTAALASNGLNVGLQNAEAAAPEAAAPKESKWVTASCWHNCGGRCLLKAQVVDGVVTRVKTDDTHADSTDWIQQRACARGRAQRQLVFGADRLKYPMKRKNWAPGGGKKELRGKDEWVRITWDEALDIVASELKRIREKYGNEAIFNAHGAEIARALALTGGYVDRWGLVSWGTWAEAYHEITGVAGNGSNAGNDRMRLRKAKLIVMWGSNPAWSSNGSPTYHFLQAKKAGAKFIFVDPFYNNTASVLADEWIPIRPGTDTAMLLGMAHHMIVNKLHDQNFLDKYTVGFDAEHMPESADPKNNFKDYVLGTYDNTPKTPEWASEICGVPADKIRQLATEIATTKPTMIQTAGAPARINNGECLPHAMLTVAWMTGNIGIPGSGVGPNMHTSAGNAGPALVTAGSAGAPAVANPLVKGATNKGGVNVINNCEMWEAILNGKYTAGTAGRKDINIQMIIETGFGSALNQRTGASKGIKAHRKVEFVLANGHNLASHCKYADVVLPVTTDWERYGSFQSGNRDMLIWANQVVQPLYEAKDDMWIAQELGKKLGLAADKVYPLTPAQGIFNQLAGAKVMKPDGSGMENLVTITEDDIKEMGVTGKPQQGRITIKEYREKGVYCVQRAMDDKLGYTAFEAYIQDPVKNKVATKSGKLEIYSKAVSDWIKDCGFNTKDPLPKYDPPIEGYEETVKDPKYPLQLYTIHYMRRSHSSFDSLPWLREAYPQEFMMNPLDAQARGIKQGDIVKITSRHGAVVRPVYVTERMMPGVTTLGEGAWIDIDEETGIDRGGATNTLNGDFATGQGHSGHNTCIVQVEKWNGTLPPDSKWAQRIPVKGA